MIQKIDIEKISKLSAPWPQEIKEALSYYSFEELDKVLKIHPGHHLYVTWKSLESLLGIFSISAEETISGFDDFQMKAQNPDFFSRPNTQEFKRNCLQVNKNLYHLSSLFVAIYNVTQKFRGHFYSDRYKNLYESCYTNSEEHHLIKAVRNALSHHHFSTANYSVKVQGTKKDTAFYIYTKDLLENGNLKDHDKDHIRKYNKLDVRKIFDLQINKITEFYNSLENELANDVRYSDYIECKMSPKRNATRTWWTILITQIIAKNLDPYNYLDNHFNNEELLEITKLPHRSKEQIDRMIKIYDETQACDEAMREKIYKFFGAK
jgi:hypothetical protein